MAFTVEDGTGISTATSYCSVVFADTHHVKDKRTAAAWAALSTGNKQYRLETATQIIDRECYFAGTPSYEIEDEQALQWPRYGVYDRNENIIDSDRIPLDLQRATAQLAGELELKALDVEHAREVSSFGAGQGAISVSFAEGVTPRVLIRSVMNYLKPYLTNGGSLGIGSMVR